MDTEITRRDFLNAVLLGTGAALLELPAPARLLAQVRQGDGWDGYGGVGDYAGSHGNTSSVVRAAHGIRDGRYGSITAGDAADTGETFDLVIVGGGLSGLGAALRFKKTARAKQRCLVIENHSVFGGEAKRNEFVVNGQTLTGPQGSNSFVVLDEPGTYGHDLYAELDVPRTFRYRELPPEFEPLRFDRTNFGFMLWNDAITSCGYFFDGAVKGEEPRWVRDIWQQGLSAAPFSEQAKRYLLAWRNDRTRFYKGEDAGLPRWLDTMTYKDYIEKVMGLGREVTGYADPIMASSIGLGCDAISAYGAYQIAMPGFRAFMEDKRSSRHDWHSFPGGNDGFARYFMKRIIPESIRGKDNFRDILTQPVDFGALDREGSDIGVRLGALAVSVEHNAEPEHSGHVRIIYLKEGRLFSIRAGGVVMANGSWVTRRIVKGLPDLYKEAYSRFFRSPVLVVNVALTNWRFLYKLGITACRWFDGFGFSCNIRLPMMVGDDGPPLDPGKPVVLTFYVPFYYPGLPAREQGTRGRTEMLSTSYAAYELKIREQLVRLFGPAGFDPRRDIAGVILNRWGHAYVNPQPGFYFGSGDGPAPRDIIRKPFGRIAFAHSELNGHQHWVGAAYEGSRAAQQILEEL